MADAATKTITIVAPPDVCYDIVADFERYPEWVADIVDAQVVERDDQGRPHDVRFTVSALGRNTRYTLRYDYREAPNALSWQLVEGDIMRAIDGAYHFSPSAEDGSTDVTYDISIELVVPMPGFLKRRAEARILNSVHHLKSRARVTTPVEGDGPGLTHVLLFTGKGGVGKTTLAAATALACADRGGRTLVISTDPAHSLADALDVTLGHEIVEVAPRLDAQQLDARRRLEEQWGELRSYVADVLDWAGVRAIEAEELTLLPGFEEVLALTDLVDLAQAGRWDVIVVDCAPTAETLRLLSLPEILSWWMDRLFPIGRQVTRLVGPVIRTLTNLPVADGAVFDTSDRLRQRLGAVRDLLGDRSTTSVRLVVNPEKVVIAEARRTATYLALFGFLVDAVVVNRLLPDAVLDPWFDHHRRAQAGHLLTIEEGFAPVPVLRSELVAEEPVGVARLRAVAAAVYAERDPGALLHDGDVLEVEHQEGGWTLTLTLPFTDREDVALVRRGGELVVTVGAYRRALVLPDALAGRRVVDTSVRQGQLRVVFADG